jgi:hypothetical protein
VFISRAPAPSYAIETIQNNVRRLLIKWKTVKSTWKKVEFVLLMWI